MSDFDRSQILGQTYATPQVAPTPAAPPVAPMNDGIQVLEGLQHVQGETAAYYQKVAALKSFMNEVNTNYGIDVRVPDMSRPESIELNKIYQTALADIMAQGNLLKQSATIQAQNAQMGNVYAPGVDTSKTAIATLGAGVGYAQDELEPMVIEANKKLSQQTYTKDEQRQQEAYRAQVIADLEERKRTDPKRAWYWQRQIEGVVKPTWGDYRPQSQWSYQDRANARKVEASGNILSKVTHLAYGAHSSFVPDPNRPVSATDPTPMLVSKEFYGQNFGGRHLERWEFNPVTKVTTIFFREGGSMEVSGEGDTYVDPQELTAQLGNVPIEAVNEWAATNNKLNKFDQVDRSLILDKDAQKKRDEAIAKASDVRDTTGPAIDLVREELKTIPYEYNRFWSDDEGEKSIGPFNIKRTAKGWTITNLQEVFKGKMSDDELKLILQRDSKYQKTEAGYEALVKFLTKYGAHIEAYKKKGGYKGAPASVNPGLDPAGVVDPAADEARRDAEARKIYEQIKARKK